MFIRATGRARASERGGGEGGGEGGGGGGGGGEGGEGEDSFRVRFCLSDVSIDDTHTILVVYAGGS